MLIFKCEHEIKSVFLDKPNVGDHSEGLECVDKSNIKRETGRKKKHLLGSAFFDALNLIPRTAKMLIFSCENDIQ